MTTVPKIGRLLRQNGTAHWLDGMQIPVLLDRSRRDPLTGQLVGQLRDAIRQARIRPGTRLPSSRRLAEQLAVSRNTVVRAYDALMVEGYVESRPSSGIFVADHLPDAALKAAANGPEPTRVGALSHMPLPPLPLRVHNLVNAQRGRLSFDFFPGRPSAALFPVNGLEAMVDWIFAGIPVRFPTLKIALSEAGASWVPMALERLRRAYRNDVGKTWPAGAPEPEELVH